MSCLKFLNPVEALGKLLGDQDECIEPVYRSTYDQIGESVSVRVELQLPGFITKGDGACLDDAKQEAALAMMEKMEEIQSPGHGLKTTSVLMKSDQIYCRSPHLTLKASKKFWTEWRLQKQVTNLLKQLAQVKGQDFSCLDDQLNKVRHLYVVQDMENQSTLVGNNTEKIEKLPSVEMKANEKTFPLTKETLEIHDKKVGKMTVIDRLGISSRDNTGEDIDKKNHDEEALTETTSVDSINTFDAKSSGTFDQSEEADALSKSIYPKSNQVNQFSSTFSGNPNTESNQNNIRKMINFKNDYAESDKIRCNRYEDRPAITEPTTEEAKEEKSNGIEESRPKKEQAASDPTTESPLKWLMLLVQSGCDYEAEENDVLRCLSKFGEVELLKWAKGVGYYKGGGGRVKFADNSTAIKVVNRVFTVDGCSFHTSWRRQDLHLLEGPVPFQVLLESDHLPHTWEKHMVVKKAMVQYGEVLAVDFIHKRKVVVSFSDEWVVQNLIGCWWKVNGTPVLAKEVSSFTLDN